MAAMQCATCQSVLGCCLDTAANAFCLLQTPAVSRESNYKGAIYMVFDYAEHDLTGLLERTKYKITASQVRSSSSSSS